MNLHKIITNEKHWNIKHAQAVPTRYNTGDRVWGSNLNIYELNADKGGGIPGDPTVNPVSGDGSTSADWVNKALSQVETSRHEDIQILQSHIDPGGNIVLAFTPSESDAVRATIDGIPNMQNGNDFTVAGSIFTLGDEIKAAMNSPTWTETLPIMDVHYHTVGSTIGDTSAGSKHYSIIHTYNPPTPPLLTTGLTPLPIALGFNVEDCDILDWDVRLGNQYSATLRANVKNMSLGTPLGAAAWWTEDSYFTWEFATQADKNLGNAIYNQFVEAGVFQIFQVRGLTVR